MRLINQDQWDGFLVPAAKSRNFPSHATRSGIYRGFFKIFPRVLDFDIPLRKYPNIFAAKHFDLGKTRSSTALVLDLLFVRGNQQTGRQISNIDDVEVDRALDVTH